MYHHWLPGWVPSTETMWSCSNRFLYLSPTSWCFFSISSLRRRHLSFLTCADFSVGLPVPKHALINQFRMKILQLFMYQELFVMVVNGSMQPLKGCGVGAVIKGRWSNCSSFHPKSWVKLLNKWQFVTFGIFLRKIIAFSWTEFDTAECVWKMMKITIGPCC